MWTVLMSSLASVIIRLIEGVDFSISYYGPLLYCNEDKVGGVSRSEK